MPLEISKHDDGPAPILKLSGVVADTDVYRFSKELKILVKSGRQRVALDVTELEFMNSHGLGVLVVHANSMQKENRELVIVNENPRQDAYMNGLFSSTGLDNVLTIVSDKKQLTTEGTADQA